MCRTAQMGESYIIKGNIVYAKNKNELAVQDSMCIIDGKISHMPKDVHLPILDYKNSLIIPGLCDMHTHAPQYANRGLGLNLELLPWLEKYTFAEESKFANEEYSREVYTRFVNSLIKNGTTRACVFATVHKNSTLILMDLLEKAGLQAYVGKANMDRNAPESLTEDTQKSIEETIDLIEICKNRYKNVKYIVTPRFIPSCTPKLSEQLGKIAQNYKLPIQSHLCENKGEIKWVAELEPNAKSYADAYNQYNLLTKKTLMAHCVHCREEEIALMAKNGTTMVHCPDSNINLSSGIANVRKFINMGVQTLLGTDIAGGCNISMLDTMAKAVQISKLNSLTTKEPHLTFTEVFYMATTAGAQFFGTKGGFAVGEEFFGVVVDDSQMLNTEKLTLAERLERVMYLGEDRKITEVFVSGRKAFVSL